MKRTMSVARKRILHVGIMLGLACFALALEEAKLIAGNGTSMVLLAFGVGLLSNYVDKIVVDMDQNPGRWAVIMGWLGGGCALVLMLATFMLVR